MTMTEKMSLTELQFLIRDSLYTSLPDFFWITAEISEIRDNYAGHCYLELVEKHPDEINVRAKARGIIWNNRLRFIRPLFESSTGEKLRAGLKILIRVKIEYHEIYGLSLIIHDLDPAFTLGEMALKRQQIIRRLEEEGVIAMNRELELPDVPQRIAVISSQNAAGYQDFMKHLHGNSYGYVFYTALFGAVMQGSDTEPSVIEALDRVASHAELFDAVVIVRGGGSQSDLSWFDNYNLAYHITQFPLPVITGIGHEKDLSVADIVAWRAEKTPTAVADFLVNCLLNTEENLIRVSSEISTLSFEAIEKHKFRLDNSRIRVIPVARMMVTEERERLSGSIIRLVNSGKGYILNAASVRAGQSSRLKSAAVSAAQRIRTKLDETGPDLRRKALQLLRETNTSLTGFSNQLGLLDPVKVLMRGYTLTSVRGKIIKSASQAEKGDQLETRFADGIISSHVTDRKVKQ